MTAMLMQPPPAQPSTHQVQMQRIEGIIAQLLAGHAHADVVISIRDGKIQLVNVNQRFLPNQLPRVG